MAEEIRPECSAAFARIANGLDAVTKATEATRTEVGELTRSHAAVSESVKGLWHEVREQRGDLKALPGRIEKTVDDHAAHCPARRKAMRRAEGDSDPAIPANDTSQIVELQRGGVRRNGSYEVPRPLLWLGALIGAAVAASGYVLHMLSNL